MSNHNDEVVSRALSTADDSSPSAHLIVVQSSSAAAAATDSADDMPASAVAAVAAAADVTKTKYSSHFFHFFFAFRSPLFCCGLWRVASVLWYCYGCVAAVLLLFVCLAVLVVVSVCACLAAVWLLRLLVLFCGVVGVLGSGWAMRGCMRYGAACVRVGGCAGLLGLWLGWLALLLAVLLLSLASAACCCCVAWFSPGSRHRAVRSCCCQSYAGCRLVGC